MDCSDKNRRSLSQALQTAELSDNARAFVAGKVTRPGAEAPACATPKPPPESLMPAPPTPTLTQNGVLKSQPLDSFPSSVGIASITVRLPARLPSRLLRASVERKLLREQPFTQQDIVADALDAWLRLHGYPDSRSP